MLQSTKLETFARSASPGGIVPLATGIMGWCPAYSLIGLNTCPLKKD